MDFRLEFTPPPAKKKIQIGEKVFLIGSCFTEHMYGKLASYKFNCIQNPNGTLFNPISIFNALNSYILGNPVEADSLFIHNGRWNHWSFHSSLSSHDKSSAVDKMNEGIANAHLFLKNTDTLFITLGSAFVYEIEGGSIVANCHKVPADRFTKRLLDPEEIVDAFSLLESGLHAFNPSVNVIFTISPVRHLRDGFVENNRSKAVLIHAVNKILDKYPHYAYFPAYELVIDDLRDYRFYAEDMVHPNYQATRYVWEKFCNAYIDGRTREYMKELDQVNMAMQHKIQHPGSPEHQKFMLKYRNLLCAIAERFPGLDFSRETAYFGSMSA